MSSEQVNLPVMMRQPLLNCTDGPRGTVILKEKFDLPVAMVLLEMIDQGYSLSSRGMLLSDAIAALRSESC